MFEAVAESDKMPTNGRPQCHCWIGFDWGPALAEVVSGAKWKVASGSFEFEASLHVRASVKD